MLDCILSCGGEGRAENVTDVAAVDSAFVELVELLRAWLNRCPVGVVGAWAIWAIPLPWRSMLSNVVGLVLAAMLRKVRGLDK